MEFIDLSKHVFDENGRFTPFESTSLKLILGHDSYKILGFLIPSKDENHQTVMVMDYNDYRLKTYKRQRRNKDSDWEDWQFTGYIE